MRLKALIAFAALALLALLPPPLWAGVTVRIAPEAVVRTDEISLGDVATVEGDETLARRLRQVKLGPAPLPGGSQQIDPGYLRLRLGELHLEPSRVRLSIPEQVVVTRAFQILPGSALVEAVSRQIQQRLDALAPQGGPWAVVVLSRPADLRVPTGTVDLVTQLQGEPSPQSSLGATVTIKVDGRSYQTVPLSVRVGRYQDVVVAARALEPRSPLGPGDFRVEPRPSTEIPAGTLSALPDAMDLEVTRPVRAGEALTPALLRQRIVVRRGELVTLVLEGPGFRILAQGVAVADARRGETLRVLNPASKREALGKVEGPGLVRVPFGEPGRER
jgi:flagella basal body P-ring formation protein FlgA